MRFPMVPITSSNSIDKWVILGEKVDFSQFSPKVFNMFDCRVPTYPTQMLFYDSEYYSSICSSKWHKFRVSAPLQTVTINVLSENMQFEMNIADFWRKLIKGLYKPKLNIKTCFL